MDRRIPIYVLADDNTVKSVIDTYESMVWVRRFYAPGEFDLIVRGTQENMDLLKPDTKLARACDCYSYVYSSYPREVLLITNPMIIEGVEMTYDAEHGWRLHVTGRGLIAILQRRIVWEATVYSGKIDHIMRQVVYDATVGWSDNPRVIPGMPHDTTGIMSQTDEISLHGENIGEWLESYGREHGVGVQFELIASTANLLIQQGADHSYNNSLGLPPVVFSREFYNLVGAQYSYDQMQYKNAAIVRGENNITVEVGTASGLDRYEVMIDGSSVKSEDGQIITPEKYRELLANYGRDQLLNNRIREEVQAEIIDGSPYTLGEDYNVGDIVQVDAGVFSAKARIVEVAVSIDASGIKTVPTFDEWVVDTDTDN